MMSDIISLVTVMRGAFCFSTNSRLSVRAFHDCDKHEKHQVDGFLRGDAMFTEKQIDLFWSNVDVRIFEPNECWNWKLSTDRYGYGKVRIGGIVYIAHRAAYEIINMIIPSNKHILHKCDNPLCCNPLHLYPGTHLDNMHDMTNRGRRAKVYGNRKMSFEKAEALRADFRMGASKRSLSRKYDIAPKSVRDILREISWKSPLPH